MFLFPSWLLKAHGNIIGQYKLLTLSFKSHNQYMNIEAILDQILKLYIPDGNLHFDLLYQIH